MAKYVLLAALFFSACRQTPVDCKAFKTGTFMYEGPNEVYRIVRTSHEQTETNLTTGEVSKWDVRWLDDCSYEITFRERSTDRPTRNHKITVRITNVEQDYATFETYANDHLFGSNKMQKVK